MAITRTAMIDDDGSGTTGTILNNAWKQELYNQIDAVIAGIDDPWKPFVPRVMDAGTTTLGATTHLCQWRRLSVDTVLWFFTINPITVVAATGAIFLTDLPFTIHNNLQFSPLGMGSFPWFAQPDAYNSLKTVGLYRQDGVAWAAGNQYVQGMLILRAT